jgi:hypothetical protein
MNHRKFNSEIQDPKLMTLRRWRDDVTPMEQWRDKRHDDVTPTGAMTSLRPVVRRSNIETEYEIGFNDVQPIDHQII